MAQISTRSFHTISSRSLRPEERSDAEIRWVNFQPYLLSQGYDLRPRYQPDWVPSWTITGSNPFDCEDSANSLPLRVLDATRVIDKLQVVIKMIAPSDDDREGEEELALLQHFSTPPHKDNPSNHIVPLLDSFPIPGVEGGVFVVMPLLSIYNHPPFYDLNEVQDFLSQIFEGLIYLHKHDVAHCDIAPANIMMDSHPLYDEPFHPFYQHRSLDGKRRVFPKHLRSQRPVRYYYIDLGYAKWFRDPNATRTLTGSRARERTPEQITGDQYDPFRADIFQLGAILRRELIPKYAILDFLLPLAREMTDPKPENRPTLEHARYDMISQFQGLGSFRKRWPIIPPNAPLRARCLYILAGVATEIVILFRTMLRLVLLGTS
ncbi:kinase-like protein [Ceratobasidium sp. AG-I]|nr:kinase-like protein [Ceratobasidium sp. AG-I]